MLGATLRSGPGTAEVILAAEPGAGDTGRTLVSEGIAGGRGALGISSKAGGRVERL